MATAQQATAEALGIGPEAEQLGRRLLRWARALELQALSRAGTASPDARSFCGRAGAPVFFTKPALDKPRLTAAALRVPGGYSILARLWATLRALAARVRSALRSGASTTRLHLARGLAVPQGAQLTIQPRI